MNESEMILWIGLGAALVIGIGAPLIAAAIRNKDFKDQVSGKKPERKIDSNRKISYDKPQSEDPAIAAGREGLRMKGGQNLLGGGK